MATLEQLSAALIKADAAGNVEDAKAFANAIRQMRVVEAPAPYPATPRDQIPGTGGLYAAPPAVSEVPLGRRVIEMLRPTGEALGGALGAQRGAQIGALFAPALGPFAPAGPIIGGVIGGGLGYATAKTSVDVPSQVLGYQRGPATAGEAFERAAGDIGTGMLTEGAGQLVGPAVGKGAEYLSKIANVKFDTYLKALDGKGDDILETLRGTRAAVPGAAPGAGEVAAPAGSVGFSMLQSKAQKVPAMASEFAAAEAQTAAAQAAQQTRAQAKFESAAAKVRAKMNSALSPMRPEDAGAALVAGAEAKREAVKKGVIEPAYNLAFKEAGDTKIDMSKVVAEAEQILGRKLSDFDPSTAPETVRKLLALQAKAPAAKPIGVGEVAKRIKGPTPAAAPAEVTLQQLDDIRKAVNVDIAAGRTSMDPGAGMRLRSLGKIHTAIDDAVESSTTLPDAAKAAYNDALNLYRTEYVPKFKTGVNDQLFRATGLNEPKIKPEDVITKYFQPRGVSEARNFVTLFGQDPKAMQTARAGIEDLYMREVKVPTPEAHAAFLQKYADPIKVLDDAGMNVLQRVNVVGQNAARLQKIDELAKRTNVKLTPALPPGATADAVGRRLTALTNGLTPQQLSHVNAVQQDLIRRGEYDRLVKAGSDAGIDIKQIGTQTGRELGLPLPAFLSVPLTVFNNVAKRLMLKLDDKLAMEIAREMTDPALAAESVQQALKLQAARQAGGKVAPEVARAAAVGIGTEMARRAQPPANNALAPESVNALAP
tara:strand:+ start:12132 stop:14432 length:2301 start_codon:yes stop_codon:yes gene_type:complete